MKTYRVSRSAKRDLNEIFLYWAEREGLEVAGRLIDEIAGRFWILAEFPSAGHSRDDVAPGVRSLTVGKYLVYYRKMHSRIEILHVFHGARDQARACRKSQ